MLAYLPRNTLGLPTSLFPFAEDIYRIFMVFMAFFIVINAILLQEDIRNNFTIHKILQYA